MIKKNIKVRWIKSKNDIIYNFEMFQKESNILFITGLVGSGKSTLAKKLGKKLNATVIIQDYLSWSDCYNNKECSYFTNLFQKLYPETKEYFKNNEWRKHNLTATQKEEYRRKFDKMIIDYARQNKNKNFIYEDSDLFCKSDISLMINKPIIIKRTSAITSFIRSYKRGKKHNNSFSEKIKYLKRMKHEFYKFYILDLPKLNNFITSLNKHNNK